MADKLGDDLKPLNMTAPEWWEAWQAYATDHGAPRPEFSDHYDAQQDGYAAGWTGATEALGPWLGFFVEIRSEGEKLGRTLDVQSLGQRKRIELAREWLLRAETAYRLRQVDRYRTLTLRALAIMVDGLEQVGALINTEVHTITGIDDAEPETKAQQVGRLGDRLSLLEAATIRVDPPEYETKPVPAPIMFRATASASGPTIAHPAYAEYNRCPGAKCNHPDCGPHDHCGPVAGRCGGDGYIRAVRPEEGGSE